MLQPPLLPLSEYRTFVVVDCETTGLDPLVDRLVEVAAVRFAYGQPTASFESLVNPGIPIPPQASAVHFLTDDDVVGAPGAQVVLEQLRKFVGDDELVVAHNAPFDSGFLTSLNGEQWICSLRAARHMWPDAPDHKNQTLRFWLKIRHALLDGVNAHRAHGDALTTGLIFDRALEAYAGAHPLHTLADFAAFVASPLRPQRFGYGRRYRGWLIDEIPLDYRQWVLRDAEAPEGQRRMNVDPDTLAAIAEGLRHHDAA